MHKFLEDCGKGWVLGNVLGAPIATIVMLWLHKYRFAGLFAVCTICFGCINIGLLVYLLYALFSLFWLGGIWGWAQVIGQPSIKSNERIEIGKKIKW